MYSHRAPAAVRTPRACRPPSGATQLLDAALEVIARDGYAGVSIDAIAREAGVTRPVVYGVFDGLGRCCARCSTARSGGRSRSCMARCRSTSARRTPTPSS